MRSTAKTTWAAGALLGLALAAAPAAHAGPGASPRSTESRDFRITYRTRVPVPEKADAPVEVWVPLPWDGGVQHVRDLSVKAPIPYEVTVEPVNGNRMVHVRLEKMTEPVTIEWTAVVSRTVEAGQEQAQADAQRWLEGDRLAPVDEAAKRMAHEIGADDAGASVRERARRIYDHVVASTEYDKTEPGWGTGDFARVCRVNKGNCSDFTSRFVTIARAARIPARWVSTISLSEEHAACDACGYHCYGYFLDEGAWIPVDPSDARRIRDKDAAKADWYFGHAERSNVILTVGRDIELVPRQQGAPVNFLAGPYMEVDGRPVALEGKDRTYEYEAL